MLELDGSGRVSRLMEEDLRPAGLLWGQPREALLNRPLDQLLLLGPGQTAAGLLTESGIAKKSSLKMGAKTGAKEHIKVRTWCHKTTCTAQYTPCIVRYLVWGVGRYSYRRGKRSKCASVSVVL